MEDKFFVCTNTYYLKDFIHPKNIRYCYLNSKVTDKPTSKLDFDIETSSDFYSHIKYFHLKMKDEKPKILYEASGEKIGDCESWWDFQTLMMQLPHNHSFLRIQKMNSVKLFDSIADAAIKVQEWIYQIAEQVAKEAIINNLEGEE